MQARAGAPTGMVHNLGAVSQSFRELLRCLTTRLFATDGTGGLGEAALQEVLARRVAEVDRAVNAESARWGDSASSPSEASGGVYTHVDWLRETGWLRDVFMPQRGAIVQGQLSRLWNSWPATAEPSDARCDEIYAAECVFGCCVSEPCLNGGRCKETVAPDAAGPIGVIGGGKSPSQSFVGLVNQALLHALDQSSAKKLF